MLKASGCLNSTSSEALEILTNTVPMDLQLKLRQAQEVIRISVKYDNDRLKEEFNRWCAGDIVVGRKFKEPYSFSSTYEQIQRNEGNSGFRLNGGISDISRQGQNDLVRALAQYVKSTKRFI